MSRSAERGPRRGHAAALAVASLAAAVLAAGAPAPAVAHALGQTFQLPIPLGLYLGGAAAAVGASFIVTAIVARRARAVPRYPTRSISATVTDRAHLALQVLGMVWWYGALVAGIALGDITPLPAVLVWIGIWVGLPIVAVLVGNPWPSLSPFRTTFGIIERGMQLIGLDRLDMGLAYSERLARWPAVALLAVGLWAELILPGATAASTVALLLLGYTTVTLLGMILFGRGDWLRNAELFEVLLGWFGRVGPIGRRSASRELCADCPEGCDPSRCVDCPDCAATASHADRSPELRPWFAGLAEVGGAGWSDAAFIILALAGVTYDGLRETIAWGGVLDLLMPPLLDLFGPTETAFTVVGIVGLASVFVLFVVAFLAAVWTTRRLSDPDRLPDLGLTAGAYGATLLPIAGGYVVAHYLTLVIQGATWIPGLLLDPLSTVAPSVDWIPIALVWYLSVAAIVIGHIAAIVLAHRITLRDAPRRPIIAGLPLVALMVGYTVLSLWVIAQPITVEPSAPAALGATVRAPI